MLDESNSSPQSFSSWPQGTTNWWVTPENPCGYDVLEPGLQTVVFDILREQIPSGATPRRVLPGTVQDVTLRVSEVLLASSPDFSATIVTDLVRLREEEENFAPKKRLHVLKVHPESTKKSPKTSDFLLRREDFEKAIETLALTDPVLAEYFRRRRLPLIAA